MVWGDLKELWSWDGETPIHIGVESARLKGAGSDLYKGVEQHAFLTAHACKTLLRYAEWYKERRELTDSPLLIAMSATGTSQIFSEMHPESIRTALLRLGPWTPHDLRRFAQTRLEAEVNPNWVRKMMGRKVKGEEDPYSLPKIEELREAFRKAEHRLTLAEPEVMESKETRINRIVSGAILQGLPPEEAEPLRERLRTVMRAPTMEAEMKAAEEARKWVEKHRGQQNEGDNPGRQRVIDESQLENHLSHGWRFVASLGNGKCVVEHM